MKHVFILGCSLLWLSFISYAQRPASILEGKVEAPTHQQGETILIPLENANLFWLDTGKGTVTDANGKFQLEKPSEGKKHQLVVSYIGYKTDTLVIQPGESHLHHRMTESKLTEVVIETKQKGEFISKLNPIQTQTITTAGLQKLPCCNLSESFENTAAVDVEFSDAVSGAKQIRMLGLDGKFSQILMEKVPEVRGLSAGLGLMFIPGSFIESIQISKGTSSVIDGFESITGQINVEYKKPESTEDLHVNLYGNIFGRGEANIYAAQKVNERWHNLVMGHYSIMRGQHDIEGDGFLNIPMSQQVQFVNRWRYDNGKNHEAILGLYVLDDDREGGQVAYFDPENPSHNGAYGIGIRNKRYKFTGKTGFFLPGNHHQSIGFIFSATYHDFQGKYGNRTFDALQQSIYSNIIFNTGLGHPNHSLSTGFSLTYDDFSQYLDAIDYSYRERIPGVFAEYNYNNSENFNLIAGLRYDWTMDHGQFFTPRLHAKYQFTEDALMRVSAGKGFRVPNVIFENAQFFPSSRSFILNERIQAEEAYNVGINYTHDFHPEFLYGSMGLSVDFYRTDFVNQLIADADQSLNTVVLYNLNGRSYSNSFQTDLSMEVAKGFDLSLAFRVNDVQITINDQLRSKPFVNRYKGLVSGTYATRFNKWTFDLSLQYNGTASLPLSLLEADELQYRDATPAFFMLHGQITRKFKYFSIYFGGENLTNFTQEQPIIDPQNPFGDAFDASMVWGPLMGRMFFVGFRYTLDN